MPGHVRYRFGPFQLDPAERSLTREGRPVRLTPKDVGVLLALVERHGALVDREQLFSQVWPGVVVEDCNVARHVANLRQALGDPAEAPIFIETLPKRGYRFVAPVQLEAGQPDGPAPDPAVAAAPGEPAGRGRPAREVAPPAPLPPAAGDAAPAHPPRRWQARWSSLALGRPRGLAAAGGLAGLALIGWLQAGPRDLVTGPIRSLAILPISNLTGDPAHDHLGEAIGAMVLTDLGRHPDLAVVSRGTSRRYRRSPLSTRDIGRELGVDGLLEAAVVRADDQVRVTAELVDTRTDRLVWAEVFEGDAGNLMELEDLIAEAVLEALELGSAASVRPEVARPHHLAAPGPACGGRQAGGAP